MERVSVFVDRESETIQKVYFGSGRGDTQGKWYKPTELEFSRTSTSTTYANRLIAYVSLGSHVMYPKPGKYYRLFGTCNDVAVADGYVMDKPQVEELSENHPLMKFPGYMGFPYNHRVPYRESWWRNERQPGLSKLQRFIGWFHRYWCCGQFEQLKLII
jgi:hypothetical protein